MNYEIRMADARQEKSGAWKNPLPKAPRVEIFWLFKSRLFAGGIPVEEAPVFGDLRGYEQGHEEVWEVWQRNGTAPLQKETFAWITIKAAEFVRRWSRLKEPSSNVAGRRQLGRHQHVGGRLIKSANCQRTSLSLIGYPGIGATHKWSK